MVNSISFLNHYNHITNSSLLSHSLCARPELYAEFFHIVQLPLLTEEVRGPAKLEEFSKMLVEGYVPPSD